MLLGGRVLSSLCGRRDVPRRCGDDEIADFLSPISLVLLTTTATLETTAHFVNSDFLHRYKLTQNKERNSSRRPL